MKKRGKYATSQKSVRKSKALVYSKSSVHLTAQADDTKKSRKLNGNQNHQTGVALVKFKKGGTDIDNKHSMSTRMSVNAFPANNYKLSSNVFPTLSPEETLLKLFYSDIYQLDTVKYFNQSCWLKSLCDYKMFCLHVSETKIDNPVAVLEKLLKTDHVSSENEISVSLGSGCGFSVRKPSNSVVDEIEDQSQTCLLGRQLPFHAGICSSISLLPSVIRQFPETLSTLAHLPAESISNEGKQFPSECLGSNASCPIGAEIVHDFNSKLKCGQHCSEDSTRKVKSLNSEECTYIENIASFKKCLYSLMRYQCVIQSPVNNDKLWWEEISFLHVYKITVAGIFLYFFVT